MSFEIQLWLYYGSVISFSFIREKVEYFLGQIKIITITNSVFCLTIEKGVLFEGRESHGDQDNTR